MSIAEQSIFLIRNHAALRRGALLQSCWASRSQLLCPQRSTCYTSSCLREVLRLPHWYRGNCELWPEALSVTLVSSAFLWPHEEWKLPIKGQLKQLKSTGLIRCSSSHVAIKDLGLQGSSFSGCRAVIIRLDRRKTRNKMLTRQSVA